VGASTAHLPTPFGPAIRYTVRIGVSSYEDVVELCVTTPMGEFKAVAIAALHVRKTRPGGRIEFAEVTTAELEYAFQPGHDLVDDWVRLPQDEMRD